MGGFLNAFWEEALLAPLPINNDSLRPIVILLDVAPLRCPLPVDQINSLVMGKGRQVH